ncbi:hypothetical protein [Pseudomonas aegrilactucae]|uniref:Secreted protein n=1 Tax=Pseudomonas aegrilactucae TaxID=2854028 RepID=A0A9Q2XLQ7_9PSED|nr:hypothetical protein [Pseudomonas aegrilactucae]MBV6288670.1 hypothetical protein [Pseudomonas aegrilactucae]
MKRTAITGLFLSAALLASPVFAADDLCATNLQKIDDNMATAGATSQDTQNSLKNDVDDAKAAQAAGNTKDCIEITGRILQDQDKATKGDSGSSGS